MASVAPSGGTASGLSLWTRSPSALRASRLVARMWTRGAALTMRAARLAAASMTCSQLSSTRRIRLSRTYATRSGTGSSDRTDIPSSVISEGTAIAGSLEAPRSRKRTSPEKASRRSCATATATVVLPIPPGPTTVTKRLATSSADTEWMSSARPTILARRGGRWSDPGRLAAILSRPAWLSADRETGATKQ